MIFAAIAIAWLAYLVPHFARGREGELVGDEADPVDRFSDSMRIVRRGTAPLLDQDLAEITTYEVSTPQTRRAAIKDLRRLDSLATLRRRRVLLVLLALLSLTIGLAAVDLIAWWGVAVPGGLLVAFGVVARVSVRAMRRGLDVRFRTISQGSSEKTVILSRQEVARVVEPKAAAPKTTTAKQAGALWDPVPITVPTYVSKPLAPRTVRTIDLSGPGVSSSTRHGAPVTADAPPPAGATALGLTDLEHTDLGHTDDGESQAASA